MDSSSALAAQLIHSSTGTMRYGPGMRVVLEVDQGIADFYRSLIPKSFMVKPQRHPAHVSVVRHETPRNMAAWGKHIGEQITFDYSPQIVNDETYFWLDVKCARIEEIRIELGLLSHPPWRNLFHITLGNMKGLDDAFL